METELNYKEAFEELQLIVKEIEAGSISVDELASQVQRAARLIEICRLKLTTTEETVNDILKDLEGKL